jgi:hypothetical protein
MYTDIVANNDRLVVKEYGQIKVYLVTDTLRNKCVRVGVNTQHKIVRLNSGAIKIGRGIVVARM